MWQRIFLVCPCSPVGWFEKIGLTRFRTTTWASQFAFPNQKLKFSLFGFIFATSLFVLELVQRWFEIWHNMDFKVKTREEGTVPTWGLNKGVRNKRETPICCLNMFHTFSLVRFFIYGVKSRSGHDRSQSFHPISHASGPKMTFWHNFHMILHGFAWRNQKTYKFIYKYRYLSKEKTGSGPNNINKKWKKSFGLFDSLMFFLIFEFFLHEYVNPC